MSIHMFSCRKNILFSLTLDNNEYDYIMLYPIHMWFVVSVVGQINWRCFSTSHNVDRYNNIKWRRSFFFSWPLYTILWIARSNGRLVVFGVCRPRTYNMFGHLQGQYIYGRLRDRYTHCSLGVYWCSALCCICSCFQMLWQALLCAICCSVNKIIPNRFVSNVWICRRLYTVM